ncbi:hypothetical protein A9Q87_05580 [Flavobacteriales bacterium 34_180_T64]|nr:hypothetical protein A9Q87_05580 [Flavobacteriales bacterium 34_180_T64]
MERLKKIIREKINGDQGYRLLHFMSRNRIAGFLIQLFIGRNLTKLAILNNTDKFKTGRHEYTKIYQNHFNNLKYKRLNLLEIGVGGYQFPNRGGCSLRMWKRYFLNGKIYSLDIYDKAPQEERRIKIFKGSQVDYKFLDSILEQIDSELDIIIDDGSHINEHVIGTFQYLFPKLKPGGIYVIEDTQTSYRQDYGGDDKDLNSENTMMNLFKKIPDFINYKEFNIRGLEKYSDLKNVETVHFYHNLVFIFKSKTNHINK